MILTRAAEEKNGAPAKEISRSKSSTGATKNSKVNKSLKRYPKNRTNNFNIKITGTCLFSLFF